MECLGGMRLQSFMMKCRGRHMECLGGMRLQSFRTVYKCNARYPS